MSDDDKEDDKRSGISPGLAGAAVYAGAPKVMTPALALPELALRALETGKRIDADPGVPIQRLAEFTRQETNAIRDFARARGVTVPIVVGHPGIAQDGSYFYDPDTPLGRLLRRFVTLPSPDAHIGLRTTSIPTALHEIGHAAPIFGSHRARSAFQSVGHLFGLGNPVGSAVRLGLASSVFVPPGEDASSTRRFVYDNAPALVGATMAPQIIEEARASANALRGARQYGPGIARTMAELGPAFGTYLAGAAAPVIATILAKHVVAALRNQMGAKGEGEAKTAARMVGAEVKAPGVLRSSASTAWKVGMNPPKPKTIPPNARLDAVAGGRATAKPPSKTSFYKDLISTLYNPSRGSRLATPG